MKCQICKINEANIIFTQILNNEKTVMQICSECAKKKGLTLEISKELPSQVESLVGSLTVDPQTKDTESIPDIKCPVCNLTFAEFKKSGLFGCDRCHEAFGNHIKNLLKQIHGVAKHEGKVPFELSGEADMRKELRELRQRLKRFVELEEYEKAAEIRDKINALEKSSLKK